MSDKYEAVSMDAVPQPPVSTHGRCGIIYAQVRALGTKQDKALRIPVKNAQDLGYVKMRLGKLAQEDGRRLLTSRNESSTVLFAWTVGKDGK